MGKRSRKRAAETTRAERDAARRERAASGDTRPRKRPGRPSIDDRPAAPWGNFPLSELVILVGIVLVIWGVFSDQDAGEERIFGGIVLAALGGGELALREHLAGYRSHTTLLAGVAAFVVVTLLVIGLGTIQLWVLLVIAALVFAGAFYWLRELFKRRSGGLGFR